MLDMYSLDDSRQQGNILLLQNNSYTNVVTVYGPVYKEYLAQGGSVEAILGAITNGTRIYTLEQALEAKEEALKAWDRYVNYTRIDTANRRFLQFKDVLRTAYNDAFMKASDEEKEVIASMPGYADTVKDLLNEQIGNIRSGDMNDLADTCTKIICRVRFYYNDAELILTGINKALQAKPDMDPREAALLSAVEYVANYVADQIQVVEIL